ncbi:MAG TPA: peptidylprolyl isomerase [Anaerolineales bacterium]|nr:peptidylprolyl isomerase [Anaerolineales bacterium]
MNLRIINSIVLAACCLLLAACNGDTATPTIGEGIIPTNVEASSVPATETPIPTPTPTPVPLAVVVNGESITLEEYQANLGMFQASSGTNLATDAQQVVLDDLTNQALLAQGARQAGFVVDDAALQARWDALAGSLGGAQALNDWAAAHGFSEPVLRIALRRAAEAAWMRDQLMAGVGEVAEQAHARQILLYNSSDAEQAYAWLQSGLDFVGLADDYDPLTAGELGWFPRGYLTEAALLDDAIFSLEPGSYTTVIETRLGFHIIQLIEKDAEHLLTPEARRILQMQALQTWLAEQRSQGNIQVMLP